MNKLAIISKVIPGSAATKTGYAKKAIEQGRVVDMTANNPLSVGSIINSEATNKIDLYMRNLGPRTGKDGVKRPKRTTERPLFLIQTKEAFEKLAEKSEKVARQLKSATAKGYALATDVYPSIGVNKLKVQPVNHDGVDYVVTSTILNSKYRT